jgi:hypothetical protein
MALRDQNRDKASADLLRRTLASSAAAAEPCPEPEILAVYSERALDADETAHYELHFSQCARCRDQLARLVRAAAPADPRARRHRWVWPWTWFVLTPVTAALLFAAVLVLRRPASKSASEQRLMAMQTSNQPPPVHEPGPEDRVQEAQQPPSVNPASPPSPSRMRSAAGSMQRTAPDYTAAIASPPPRPAVAPAPTDKELSDSYATNLRLQLRDDTAVQKVANPVQQAPATQTPGGGVQSGNIKQPRAQSQSVTVETDAATRTSVAPVPQTLADNSAGSAGGSSAEATPKKARPMFMAAGGAAVGNQMVAVEAPIGRSTRMLVRSPDPQVLWRISGGRSVDMSADAGATWRAQWTSPTAQVVAGSAPSIDTCWLVGRGGMVLLTTDANKWQTITPPADADFASVAAVDASSATVTATDGRQFKTSDGGKHWTVAP